MTTQPTTPKRWRPRFSVRTLVILVTLVCCYAACWGPTKTWGVHDMNRNAKGRLANDWPIPDDLNIKAIAPLFLGMEEFTPTRGPRRSYYFWFFGYKYRLPFDGLPTPIPPGTPPNPVNRQLGSQATGILISDSASTF